MSDVNFIGFYPSKRYWAVDKVELGPDSDLGAAMKLMAEVVFSKVSGTHTIEMCRDGRVMLRVEALEKERRTGSSHDIKDDVVWIFALV